MKKEFEEEYLQESWNFIVYFNELCTQWGMEKGWTIFCACAETMLCCVPPDRRYELIYDLLMSLKDVSHEERFEDLADYISVKKEMHRDDTIIH